MKLIYVVIDGMGDLPIEELENKTPLEAAETPHMDSLAERGKTGLMYPVRKGIAPESDVAVLSILGYDPFKSKAHRGPLEAYGADLEITDGDLALRCNFATLGKEKRIVDRRVGRDITTEEAAKLSEAINEKVKLKSHPAELKFKNTTGHRAALVIRSKRRFLSGQITNTDPAYSRVEGLGVARTKVEMILKECRPLNDTEEARASARLVNEFVDKSHAILAAHEINRMRDKEERLSANLILTRDAGSSLPRLFKIDARYGVSFACLADMPIERGIAKVANLELIDIPLPTGNVRMDSITRVKKLLHHLPSFDCFYIHLKGPDEPGHDGKPHLKKQVIAGVDRFFFGNLLSKIDMESCVLCVTADHSTPCKLKAHSDDPVPVLVAGSKIRGNHVKRFSERDCEKGSLGILTHGTELMPKIMSFFKSR
ncbi:MAG: 2,3-bisphosphoglycerate-independent phosphoglycerate mutase [Candidatus Bathyarchaeota archaeon]|nr:MAG: 2,3-bisphosphoglycerate-independent phosphoglycerate mutase [Candidatus Bathyarchaeota archaeon]